MPNNLTDQFPTQPIPVEQPLSLKDLTSVLIKHYNLHEGVYDLSIEFQIGVGPFGPSPDDISPGATIVVKRVGLVRSATGGPMAVDASTVNQPIPSPKRIRKKKEEK